jgi:5-formaminoimidazole-4-carboxamide-1-(beta)-D-ribofuranosyl 5'-monophosphate synthetase
LVSSYDDYLKKSRLKIGQGIINEDDLSSATIEEYVIGTYFNLNYFCSPIRGETEFLGIERRLQTNIHDFVTSVPAKQQMEIDVELQNIEVGHAYQHT